MASVSRIACVRIGRFATGALTGGQTARRSDGQSGNAELLAVCPSDRPTALFADVRGTSRIAAASAAAARRGVAVGMALAEAKALAADLVVSPYDAEALVRAALEVTTALLAASPRVAWEHGLGVWWVDAAGLGDERGLARRLHGIAHGLRLGPARVGIAGVAIAAYAAACTRRPWVIVPPGTDAVFLAPFPIAILDLDEDLADTFRALGLKAAGQLAALEEGEVEARFGPAGLAAHRLARAIDARGPTTPRDDALPAIECDLGGAVDAAGPLLFLLKGALASLSEALRAKGLAAREVVIALALDDGSRAERAVRPARPTSHEGALFDHVRATLEDWRLPAPVAALALRVAATVPAAGEQGDLLRPRWADSAALAAAFDRIRGSEGTGAVAVPVRRDGHLPEDEGAWKERKTGGPGDGGTETRSVRLRSRGPTVPRSPVSAALRHLEHPEPVRVRLGRAGLEAFRRGDSWHDVVAWSGPERLAPRWWRNDSPSGPRDYYTARTRKGALWLLFRSAKQRQWFVEGWWD